MKKLLVTFALVFSAVFARASTYSQTLNPQSQSPQHNALPQVTGEGYPCLGLILR